MTELTPGTRDWAEAEARKGAKVTCWFKSEWLTFQDGKLVDENGWRMSLEFRRYGSDDRWEIVEPAPAQEPAGYAPNMVEREPQGPVDLAAQVAALEAIRPVRASDRAEREARTESASAINSACLSYRHDFGLMSPEEQKALRFEALEWLRAWRKAEGELP